MSNTASLKKEYAERIAPALKNQFQYSSTMQIPVLKKIVINQGLGISDLSIVLQVCPNRNSLCSPSRLIIFEVSIFMKVF